MGVTALLGFAVAAFLGHGAAAAETKEACANHTPQRRALFGDLHIHTGVSADANIMGVLPRPVDAYRFARGESVPLRHGSPPAVPSRLARPLDFAAVTDHAEVIGAISLCRTPGNPAYESEACQLVRKPLLTDADAMATQINAAYRAMEQPEVCGEDGSRCELAKRKPWREIQDAAAQWNDRCDFTTFIGFEYSPTPDLAMVHRNVIFRSEATIPAPIGVADVESVVDLWERLQRECSDADGCDVMSIPHNSNMSNGRSFRLDYFGEERREEQVRLAKLRAGMEPIAEMFQLKGDSECRNGLWNVEGEADPLCEFEKIRDWQGARYEDCRSGLGSGALVSRGCISRLDYLRTAVAAGLAEERRIGVNPHKMGFIASTDAHVGSAGDTDEWVFDGVQRPVYRNDASRRSSGGLAAVWAEENTRSSIFDALRRRETFGTSGPRMQVRFFGGWGLPEGLCGEEGWVARAYADGVAMGGELPARAGEGAPVFVVSGLADPGIPEHPGGLLQRVQIVKVWPGEGDVLHQRVYDVVGGDNAAGVDLATCAPFGPGESSMCGVWSDPSFDSKVRAAYYARVAENPSCRHIQYRCNAAGDDTRPADCADESIEKSLQERAWSAPIWYTPVAS